MLASRIGVSKSSGPPPTPAPGLTLNVTTNQTNFNLFTACSSPGTARSVTVNVSVGVFISSNSAAIPAFDEGGGWAPGTTVLINNLGTIRARGGVGGAGGNGTRNLSSAPYGTVTNGTNGGDGGTAIKLTVPTTINNGAGLIYGGGGGGGGGGGAYVYDPTWDEEFPTVGFFAAYGGSGGGGGQGANSAAAGAPGTGSYIADPTYEFNGYVGTVGNSTAPGLAEIQGGTSYGYGYIFGGGGAGGGGGWGEPGENGYNPEAPFQTPAPPIGYYGSGIRGLGGAAGKAVDRNGQSLTWLSGNDSTRVKGPVA